MEKIGRRMDSFACGDWKGLAEETAATAAFIVAHCCLQPPLEALCQSVHCTWHLTSGIPWGRFLMLEKEGRRGEEKLAMGMQGVSRTGQLGSGCAWSCWGEDSPVI